MPQLTYGNQTILTLISTNKTDVSLWKLEAGSPKASSRSRMMRRTGFPSLNFILAVLVVFISLSWCDWIAGSGRPFSVPSSQRVSTISIMKRITDSGPLVGAGPVPNVKDLQLNMNTPVISSAPAIFNVSAIINTPAIANTTTIDNKTAVWPTEASITALKLAEPNRTVVAEPRLPVSKEIKIILDHLEEGEAQLTLSKSHRDIVLVLGPADAWKTTLVQFLAQNDSKLISVETAPDSEKYFILTETDSQPYPQLYLDTTNDLAFYDCPGFLETPDLSTEIPAAYFNRRLVDHARSVKLVLVAPYSAVTQGNSRLPLTSLMSHMSLLVRNLAKFRDSIALVVTDVENEYSRKTKDYVSDEIVIRNIGDFIKREAGNYKEERKSAYPLVREDEATNVRLFIQALTSVDSSGAYNKIGILRRPDEPGPIDQSKMLQRCKGHVLSVIKENLVYQSKTVADFRYTVSSRSNESLVDLAEYINNQAKAELSVLTNSLSEQLDTIWKNSSDLEASRLELKKHLNLARETLQKLNATNKDPREYFQVFQNGLAQLGNIEVKGNDNLKKYGRYINFLEESSGEAELLNVGNPLEAYQNRLESSGKWYDLLFNIYGALSSYKYQSNSSLYNVANLSDWGLAESEQGLVITEGNFIQFCNLLGFNSSGLPGNPKPSEDVLTELKTVLEKTLQTSSPSVDQANGTLTIRGRFVQFSKLKERIEKTEDDLKLVRIYATQTVFIDASLKLPGVSLSVFALNWEVVEGQTIDLDGIKNKTNLGKAEDVQVGQDGKTGAPGGPGGAAGSFLGVGRSFTNARNLHVSARGGKGGTGQNGGDGGKGMSGVEAPFPPKEGMLNKIQPGGRYPVPSYPVGIMGVDWLKSNVEEYKGWDTVIKRNFIVYGSKGERGRRGGNGGVGGKGGMGGNVRIENLDDELQGDTGSSVDNRPGDEGEAGIGGKGGIGGSDGPDLKVSWVETTHGFTGTEYEWKLKSKGDPKSPLGSGPPGLDGRGNEGMQQPKPASGAEEWALQINGFKQYLRQNLADPIIKYRLDLLQRLIEDDAELSAFYNARGLLDDFIGLESQFYQLYQTVDLRPSYESLLQRTENYAEFVFNEDDMGRRKILAFLVTALRTKILSYKLGSEKAAYPDLDEYISKVALNIEELRTKSKQESFYRQSREYESRLITDISEIQNFNKLVVTPSIDAAIEELATQVKVGSMRSAKDSELEHEYKQNIIWSSLFEIFQTMGNFATFCGSAAKGALEGSGGSIAEPFALDADKTGEVVPTTVPRTLKHALAYINELIEIQRDTKVEALRNQINQMNSMINSAPEQMQDLKIRLQRLRSKLYFEANTPVTDYNAILRLNELSDQFGSTAIQKNLDVSINQTRFDPQGSAGLGLQHLRRFEKSVYTTLSSMMTSLVENIGEMNQTLGSMSQIGIDGTKWKMQPTLKYLIQALDDMKLEFKVATPYTRTIAKLREVFVMLKGAYTRIESVREQKLLANYIANMDSPGSASIDLKLTPYEAYVPQLEQTIRSNLVLIEFTKAVSAYQQYVFPFADLYTDSYYISPTSSNSVDLLVTQAFTQVQRLRTQLSVPGTTVGELVETGHFSIEEPFYKWDNLDFKQEMTMLLKGESITLQADVGKSDKEALRVQRLEILLELSDPARQADFDSVLENYYVEFRSSGNSYFGHGGKVYLINTEPRIIGHCFQKGLDGRPKYSNKGYKRLSNGYFLLSPFALWTIQLKPRHWSGFEELREFGQVGVNLLMVGEGQYLGSGVNGSRIPDLHLDKYYQRIN